MVAAWLAHSPALLAFGGDSLIELISAGVVLWRFTFGRTSEHAEERAAKIAGGLLILLAIYVVAISGLTLWGLREPQPTLFGIFLLLAAALLMPWLGREKRKLSAVSNSAALRADAAESSLCGYLALVALAGLAVNYVWRIANADSFAALAIVPFLLYEAREALRGKPCTCAV